MRAAKCRDCDKVNWVPKTVPMKESECAQCGGPLNTMEQQPVMPNFRK